MHHPFAPSHLHPSGQTWELIEDPVHLIPPSLHCRERSKTTWWWSLSWFLGSWTTSLSTASTELCVWRCGLQHRCSTVDSSVLYNSTAVTKQVPHWTLPLPLPLVCAYSNMNNVSPLSLHCNKWSAILHNGKVRPVLINSHHRLTTPASLIYDCLLFLH